MIARVTLLFVVAAAVFARERILPADDCFGLTTKSCQNFNEARQNAINVQINKELEASYVYMAMAAYFSRSDPNHKGFAKFFSKASAEERDHALKLAEYVNLRGGEVKFSAIQAPSKHEWDSGLAAFEDALALEKEVNSKLLTLHHTAEDDPHMQDFLESHYLTEQVDSINQMNGFISQLKRLRSTNPGLGEHIFEEELE